MCIPKPLIFIALSLFLFMGVHASELKVGYIPGVDTPHFHRIEQGMQARVRNHSIQLYVSPYPPNWHPDEQIPLIEALVQRHLLDVLIIVPTDSAALSDSLKTIQKKGTEVVTIDAFWDSTDFSPLAQVGTRSYEGGKALAQALVQQIDFNGRIYVNTSFPHTSSLQERMNGFLDVVRGQPAIQIVGMDISGNEYDSALQEKAEEQTLVILQEYPTIDAIYSTNPFSGAGVYQALKKVGLLGAIKFYSWGTSDPLRQGLKKRKIQALLEQGPETMGARAIEIILEKLAKDNFPRVSPIVDFQILQAGN